VQAHPFSFPPLQDSTPPYAGLVATETGWSVAGSDDLFVKLNDQRGWCLIAKTDLVMGSTMAHTPLETLRRIKQSKLEFAYDIPPFSGLLLDACYGEVWFTLCVLTADRNW
jgi:hypothetical protein